MLTTDLALRFDPAYEKISRKFYENPDQLHDAFARAWFKLTHRDMGPVSRYVGSEVPTETLVWQDPIPKVNHELVGDEQVATLKKMIRESGLTIQEMVSTAWASASTFRGSDNRGGANGARICLEPQKSWEVNQPEQLEKVLNKLTEIQTKFNDSQQKGMKISMADLIVLSGSVGVEMGAEKAGTNIEVPFVPGRMDAFQDQTDVESFEAMEPMADGFRNYLREGLDIPAEKLLVDRSQLLTLTAPEMTVLIGGLRVLGANHSASTVGVLVKETGVLNNDFFKHILDVRTLWLPVGDSKNNFEGRDRVTGEKRFTGTRVDLIFGSNSELRGIAEVYASDDAKDKFLCDFVAAWTKVMNLDRFDLK